MIALQKQGLFHKSDLADPSLVKKLFFPKDITRTLVSYRYSPRGKAPEGKEYYLLSTGRILPTWAGHVQHFLRRERRGYRLGTNWRGEGFGWSDYVELESPEIGVEIFNKSNRVTVTLTDIDGTPHVLRVVAGSPFSFTGEYELRLSNPKDRDDRSTIELGAEFSDLRVELLSPDEEPLGLMQRFAQSKRVPTDLLALSMGVLAGPLVEGRAVSEAVGIAERVARETRDRLLASE